MFLHVYNSGEEGSGIYLILFQKANFFTTITTLGTPLDLTTQELRIELLFPSDDATKQMFPL